MSADFLPLLGDRENVDFMPLAGYSRFPGVKTASYKE